VVEVERRPLIWTDDDAIPVLGAHRRRLEEAGVPVLLLSPDPTRVSARTTFERIDAFLADAVGGRARLIRCGVRKVSAPGGDASSPR